MSTAATDAVDSTSAEAQKHTVLDIKLSDIVVPESRWRTAMEHRVAVIQESIEEIGLMQPIVLSPEFHIIAGLHRYLACTNAGWVTIPSVIKTYNEIDSELAEIDENLVRCELLPMERVEQYARRKELYKLKHGKPVEEYDTSEWSAKDEQENPGIRENADGTKKPKPNFVRDTAKKTGRAEEVVRSEAILGEKLMELLSPEIRDLLKATKVAKNKSELERLLDVPDPDVREEIARRIHQSFLDDPDNQLSVEDVRRELGKVNTYESVVSDAGAITLEKALKKTETLLLASIDKKEFKETAETWTQEGVMSVREALFELEKTIAKGIEVLTEVVERNDKLGR